jgi:hypothetical protein
MTQLEGTGIQDTKKTLAFIDKTAKEYNARHREWRASGEVWQDRRQTD